MEQLIKDKTIKNHFDGFMITVQSISFRITACLIPYMYCTMSIRYSATHVYVVRGLYHSGMCLSVFCISGFCRSGHCHKVLDIYTVLNLSKKNCQTQNVTYFFYWIIYIKQDISVQKKCSLSFLWSYLWGKLNIWNSKILQHKNEQKKRNCEGIMMPLL